MQRRVAQTVEFVERLAAEVTADRHGVAFAQGKQLKNRDPRIYDRIRDNVGIGFRVPHVAVVADAGFGGQRPIAARGAGHRAKKDECNERA